MRIRISTLAGLWASIVLIIVITAALLLSLQKAHSDNEAVHHTRLVQAELAVTQDLVQDSESGQFGYILTGSEIYLKPCIRAQSDLENAISRLRNLTRDNPTQQRNLDRLQPLIRQRMDSLRANIDLRRNRGLAAAAIATERNRAAMERVRSVLDEMQAEETRLLVQREATATTARSAITLILLFGSIGLFLLVALSTVAVQREMRRRQEAQQEQREIAERLAVTLSSIGDAVIATDVKGSVTFLNAIAAQLTGWSQAEAENRSCAEVFRIINETTRQIVESPVEKVIHDRQIVGLANHTVLLAKDGREINIDDSASPIRDTGGNLIGVILVFRDISARRLAERELDERARLAALGAEVGAALTESDTLPVMLGRCANALVRHLDGAFARIWILNAKEGMLELRASAGMYTHLDGSHSRVPVGKYKIGMIAEERQPHLTNAVVGDPHVGDQEWAKREGMVAFAGYPLIVSDRLVGVVAMFARHALTETTLQAMASVADQIALGIERKQDEEALQRSEERLRAALVASETGTFRWNLVSNSMIWDESLDRLFALPPGQTARSLENFLAMVHPDDRQSVVDCCARCRDEGADFDREFRVTWPDGTLHWLDGKGKTTTDQEGRPLYMTGACIDVTDRKLVQAEIEDLNTRLTRAMAESHHRIKNNLQMLAALVDMQRMNSDATVPVSELERLGQHIRTLASLHDLLTSEAKFGGETDTVSLPDALAKLVSMLQQTVTDRPITLRAAEIHLPLKKCGPFILLANELVSNAIKHGRGAVGISLTRLPERDGSDLVCLEVSDDGPGFPTDFDPSVSANTGVELIESMGRWDLGGEVIYKNGPEGGAQVLVTFPLSEFADNGTNPAIVEDEDAKIAT